MKMMKKILTILITSVLALTMSSCLDDNNDTSTQSMSVTMYNRVMTESGVPSFSINPYQITIDFTAAALNINMASANIDGNPVTFSCQKLPMTYDKPRKIFKFSDSMTGDAADITNVNGIIDFNIGIIYISYQLKGHQVYATSGLGYAHCNTTLQETGDVEKPASFKTNWSIYAFEIDPNKKEATFRARSFILPNSNEEAYPSVSGDGLQYMITSDGYEFTADAVTLVNKTRDQFKITNFKASVTNQGKTVNLSYDYGKYHATATGMMFMN